MNSTPTKLPTIAELFSENISEAFAHDQLNLLLNQQPPIKWIKVHPFIKEYRYLPIDKIEFMLRKIFKKYSIEILNQGTAFNGVFVVVRVHYLNPATGEMAFHDGIGGCQLQTKQGASAADLANINNGALSMAFPIAKTVAIKDACDHFGNIFGANLNRKDTIEFSEDKEVSKNALDKDIQESLNLLNDEDALTHYAEGLSIEIQKTLAFRMAYQKRRNEILNS